MTVRHKQTSFNTGELSPQVQGQTDLTKWASSVGEMTNMVSYAHGPASRRIGLEYIDELKDSSEAGRLIPFEFSNDQAYIIVANNSAFRFYKDGGVIESVGSPYEVAMTYDEDDITNIDTAQSADTLFIAQPDHKQRTLARSDHDDWTLADIDYTDGPFLSINATATTLTPSATTGTITITASAITGINSGQGFLSTDVGRLVSIKHSDTWGIAKITVVGSTTSVTATVSTTFGGTSASDDWKIGYWSGTTGYPRTVTFANERLCWAGSNLYPNYNWLSKVAEYTTHADDDTLTDASALNLPLSTGAVDAIQWLRFARKLTCGTTGSEHWLTDATGEGPITAESKQAVHGSGNGCSSVKPVPIGSKVIYLQRHDKVVKELFYEYTSDAFAGNELTVLSEHLTKEYGITRMAYQRTPNKILWCIRSDGKLLGCTYYPEHEVVGWHVHETDGWFEDVAVIPGTGRDEVWFIVKREVDGSLVRYIERMAVDFIGRDTTDAFFVDSGLTLDNRQTISSINLTTDVVTVTAHGLSNGDTIRFRVEDDPDAEEGTEGSLHMQEFIVSDQATNTFKCKDAEGDYIDFSDYTAIYTYGTNTIGKNVTTLSGLDHLEGKSVAICADGAALPNETVVSGEIELDAGASVVHAGLPYTSNLWTLTPDLPLPMGSSLSSNKSVKAATIKLYKTLGMWVGTRTDNLIEQEFATDSVPMGHAADLFTGEWTVSIGDTDNTDARVYIRQTQPLPLTVIAIETEIEIDEVED